MAFIPVTTDHSDPVSRGVIDHRFGPSGIPQFTPEQLERAKSLRENARLLARHILSACPCSWERDRAIEAVDDACSWASRAIARNE